MSREKTELYMVNESKYEKGLFNQSSQCLFLLAFPVASLKSPQARG
jgi:hypothetical protein